MQITEQPFLTTVLRQRTDSGLIDIKHALALANEARVTKGLTYKDTDKFFQTTNGKEFLASLIKDLNSKSQNVAITLPTNFSMKELKFTGMPGAKMSKQGFKENIHGIYQDFKQCSTISYRLNKED